jgi:hypothetical protein
MPSCPALAVRRTASLPLAYVPGIHVFVSISKKDVDGRDKPGHDENCLNLRRLESPEDMARLFEPDFKA